MKRLLIYILITISVCIIYSATMSYVKFYPVPINIYQEKFNLTEDSTVIPVVRFENKNLSPTSYKQYISYVVMYDSTTDSLDSMMYQHQNVYYGKPSLGDSANRWEKLHVNYAYFHRCCHELNSYSHPQNLKINTGINKLRSD